MIIEKSIKIDSFEFDRSKISKYWENKVKLTKISENKYIGKRGSLLGNLFAFNMKYLITSLEIDVFENETICKFYINTTMQIVNEVHKKYWYVELDDFEDFINYNSVNRDNMKTHLANRKKEDWKILILIFSFVFILTMLIQFLLMLN